jgi:hypothetical protein
MTAIMLSITVSVSVRKAERHTDISSTGGPPAVKGLRP